MSLPTKKDFLESVANLSYDETQAAAAKFARQFKNSEMLSHWISEMRKHPEPELPVVQKDTGLDQLLPGQKYNVAKYYNEDQIAMRVAVSSEVKVDLLIEEINSPCKLFKPLACKALSRQLKDDAVLEKQILQASSATRKALLHALIKQRRTALLEKVYPALFKDKGKNVAIDILHGCSSAFVREQFKIDEVKHSEALDWKMLTHFHAPMLIDELADALKALGPDAAQYERSEVWNEAWRQKWLSRDVLYQKTQSTRKLWALYEQYPIPIAESDYNRQYMHHLFDLPYAFNSHWSYYLKSCTKEIFAFTTKHVQWEEKYNNIKIAFYPHQFDHYNFSKNRKVSEDFFNGLYELTVAIQELAKSKKFCPANLHSYYQLCRIGYSQPEHSKKALDFLRIGLELSHQFYEAVYHIVIHQRDVMREALKVIHQKQLALNTAQKKALIEKDEKAVRANEKLRLFLQGVVQQYATLYFPYYASAVPLTKAQEVNYHLDLLEHASLTTFQYVFDLMQPFLTSTNPSRSKGNWVTDWDNRHEHCLYHLMKFLSTRTGWFVNVYTLPESAETQKTAIALQQKCFDLYIAYFKEDPIINFARFHKIFSFILPAQRQVAYKVFSFTQLKACFSTEPHTVMRTLFDQLTLDEYGKDVEALIKCDDISGTEALQGYRDLAVHEIRRELERATDSNSFEERATRIRYLVGSTFRARLEDGKTQLRRTLTFLRQKIKNEQITMRILALALLFPDNALNEQLVDEDERRDGLFPQGADDTIFELYFALLQDALEVQDLGTYPLQEIRPYDNGTPLYGESQLGKKMSMAQVSDYESHPCLRYFYNLAHDALLVGVQRPEVHRFGIDLLWRLCVHKEGPKKAPLKFRVTLPDYLTSWHADDSSGGRYFAKPSSQKYIVPLATFENSFTQRHAQLILEKTAGVPKEKEFKPFVASLLNVASEHWSACQVFNETILPACLDALAKYPKDQQGLTIFDNTEGLLSVLDQFLKISKKDALKSEPLKKFVEAVLRSRQAKVVVFQWVALKETGLSGRERLVVRDECVNTLLSITPNAIHLKLVYRHLMQWRQNRLTEFIDMRKSLDGVFFEECPFFKPKEPPAPKTTTKRTRTAAKAKSTTGVSGMKDDVKHEIKNIPLVIAAEVKKAKELADELEAKREKTNADVTTHENFFVLPVSHGFWKLQPKQSEALGRQWLEIMLDKSRAVPVRTKAAIQYTLMPTVNYCEIVKCIEKYSAKEFKLEVNLLEALMKGVMLNDEPIAPLNYMLSPEFLGSDRARIAAYAIFAAVPHLRSVGLTDIVNLVLSGKRREVLKVTAYKAMIRILASQPTSKHISMIEHEWDRKELHRDVRIAVIKAALIFLAKDTAKGVKVGWKILNETLTRSADWTYASEILMALIGVLPASVACANAESLTETLFVKPRTFDHYEQMKTSTAKVPTQHCERFANDILLTLARTCQTNDIRHAALFALMYFRNFGISTPASELLYQLLTNQNDELFNSVKATEREVYDVRWTRALRDLLRFTAVSEVVAADHVNQRAHSRQTRQREAAWGEEQGEDRTGAGHEFQYTPNNQPADKSFVVDLIRQTVQQLDDCHKRLNSGASSSPDPSSSVGLAKSTLVTDKSAQATITGLQANSGKNKQWCGVRSSVGLPFKGSEERLYFEVTVGQLVATGAQGTARVGISAPDGSFNIGTDAHSWGYGGSAKISHKGDFKDWGKTFSTGDVVGTLLDLSAGKLSFSLNGKDLGNAFDVYIKKGTQIFAACSFRNIAVTVNFGATPFKHAPPSLTKGTNTNAAQTLTLPLIRLMRSTILAHLTLLLNSMPNTVGLAPELSWDKEALFLAPVEAGVSNSDLFRTYLFERKFALMPHQSTRTADKMRALVHDLVSFVVKRVEHVAWAVPLVVGLTSKGGGEYHELVRAILDFNLGPADAQVGNNYTALLIKIGYAVMKRLYDTKNFLKSYHDQFIRFFNRSMEMARDNLLPHTMQASELIESYFEICNTHYISFYRDYTAFSDENPHCKVLLAEPLKYLNNADRVDDQICAPLKKMTLIYLRKLLSERPNYFYYFYNYEAQLHQLIDNIHPSEIQGLANHVKTFCISNLPHHGVHTFYALMVRLMEYSLDNEQKPAEKSCVYKQKCDTVTVTLLLSLTGFVHYHPFIFFRFFQTYKTVEDVELIDGRAKKMADILSLSLYLRFSITSYSTNEVNYNWQSYINEGREYMQRMMNQHEGRQSVFVRMVCCRLLCFMGYITSEPESKDSPVCAWKEELVKVLDEFCNDTDSKIQAYAWSVNVELPISLSDYSHLTPSIRDKGYFA